MPLIDYQREEKCRRNQSKLSRRRKKKIGSQQETLTHHYTQKKRVGGIGKHSTSWYGGPWGFSQHNGNDRSQNSWHQKHLDKQTYWGKIDYEQTRQNSSLSRMEPRLSRIPTMGSSPYRFKSQPTITGSKIKNTKKTPISI